MLCVVKCPIHVVIQDHALASGMYAGHQRFYVTWKPPTSLEEAFAINLGEYYSVIAVSGYHAARVDSETEQ